MFDVAESSEQQTTFSLFFLTLATTETHPVFFVVFFFSVNMRVCEMLLRHYITSGPCVQKGVMNWL